MAKQDVTIGSTSRMYTLSVVDSSKTDGSGLPGLVFNTASLTGYYYRDTDTSSTAITLATATLGTWTSGGFKEIDATNMKGDYQIGLPDACFTKLGGVVVHLQGAANMAPVKLEFQVKGFSQGNSSALAQAGGASTITLASTADATDSYYIGQQIQILSGTGIRQVRTVIAYVGSTKVATVDRAWATNPDSTSYYAILPVSGSKLSATAGSLVGGYESGQDPGTLIFDAASTAESYTLRQLLRGFFSALMGKADGGGTTTMHYRDKADTKNRLTATVDANGNRSAVTIDLT